MNRKEALEIGRAIWPSRQAKITYDGKSGRAKLFRLHWPTVLPFDLIGVAEGADCTPAIISLIRQVDGEQ